MTRHAPPLTDETMSLKDAKDILSEFIQCNGFILDCGVPEADGSRCHVCTSKEREKLRAVQALAIVCAALEEPVVPRRIRGVDFPCEACGKLAGSLHDNGFWRCKACGYPSK